MTPEVWKFRLEAMVSEPSLQAIAMPEGARILSLQMQGDAIALWAAVDPSASKVTRSFGLYKSGRPLNGVDIGRYVGTVQTLGGCPVWHIFEVA